jgi:hypothetical protein
MRRQPLVFRLTSACPSGKRHGWPFTGLDLPHAAIDRSLLAIRPRFPARRRLQAQSGESGYVIAARQPGRGACIEVRSSSGVGLAAPPYSFSSK